MIVGKEDRGMQRFDGEEHIILHESEGVRCRSFC